MSVTVVRRCTPRRGSAPRVRTDARRLLAALREADAELTVALVNDTEMQRLNRDYRGMDRPTDVLAFAMREGRRIAGDDAVLGDVVISLETAARQARHHCVSVDHEVRTLLIHGVLHLLGYDHERSPADARRMKAQERRLLQALQKQGMRDAQVGAKTFSPRRGRRSR
jgi:probable rRNA maturation factor